MFAITAWIIVLGLGVSVHFFPHVMARIMVILLEIGLVSFLTMSFYCMGVAAFSDK